ncbi:MAG: hypothetical protein K6A78_04090 [Prevotella sp.]|nr:hypothetical protein [Prevotella sp.]
MLYNNIIKTGYTHVIMIMLLLLTVVDANAKNGYCRCYEDFINSRWESLDTVFCRKNGQGRKLWFGSNDYSLTTGNESLDKRLKAEAFVIMMDDTLYINCRRVQHDKIYFRNGYAKAWRIGKHSLLFINEVIGKEAQLNQSAAPSLSGTAGNFTYGLNQLRRRVCYIISNNSGGKRIESRLVNDTLMEQMLNGNSELRAEYYSIEDKSKRMTAAHVFPILEKVGLFTKE